MIPLVSFQGHASWRTTVLKLWCKNAVCKPQVVTMVQLTAEQRIFVVKKFYETRNLQATYMEYAFGEALPDWEPPETLDLSPTAQDSRSHSHKKVCLLARSAGRSLWRLWMWNGWKWRSRRVIRLKVARLSPAPFRRTLGSSGWTISWCRTAAMFSWDVVVLGLPELLLLRLRLVSCSSYFLTVTHLFSLLVVLGLLQ